MDEEIKKRFENIEKRLGILEGLPQKETLKDQGIFEIEENKIIVTNYIGKNTEEKTQNITLLTLLGYKQKMDKIDISSSKIKENVALHEVPLENFGTHIKKLIPQSIIKKGKRGSTKITYRITVFGEAKAKKLLKELLENEKR